MWHNIRLYIHHIFIYIYNMLNIHYICFILTISINKTTVWTVTSVWSEETNPKKTLEVWALKATGWLGCVVNDRWNVNLKHMLGICQLFLGNKKWKFPELFRGSRYLYRILYLFCLKRLKSSWEPHALEGILKIVGGKIGSLKQLSWSAWTFICRRGLAEKNHYCSYWLVWLVLWVQFECSLWGHWHFCMSTFWQSVGTLSS